MERGRGGKETGKKKALERPRNREGSRGWGDWKEGDEGGRVWKLRRGEQAQAPALLSPPPPPTQPGSSEVQVHDHQAEGCRLGPASLGSRVLPCTSLSPAHVLVCTSSCLRGGWACSRGLMICAIIYSFARRETH